MSHFLPAGWLACLTLLAAASGARAQAAPQPAAAAVPPYRSALEGYVPFTDQKVAPWKESNDTVGAIGGWKAYAREAQGADAKATPEAAVADPHHGHGEKAK